MKIKKKRKKSIFSDLKKSIAAVNAHKAGKITLRTHRIEKKPLPDVRPNFIRKTRETFNMSRAIFALKLRVSTRTLEKWEQGSAAPNDQAIALILLVRKFPDILKRLEEI